jgi:hypothetical protein
MRFNLCFPSPVRRLLMHNRPTPQFPSFRRSLRHGLLTADARKRVVCFRLWISRGDAGSTRASGTSRSSTRRTSRRPPCSRKEDSDPPGWLSMRPKRAACVIAVVLQQNAQTFSVSSISRPQQTATPPRRTRACGSRKGAFRHAHGGTKEPLGHKVSLWIRLWRPRIRLAPVILKLGVPAGRRCCRRSVPWKSWTYDWALRSDAQPFTAGCKPADSSPSSWAGKYSFRYPKWKRSSRGSVVGKGFEPPARRALRAATGSSPPRGQVETGSRR